MQKKKIYIKGLALRDAFIQQIMTHPILCESYDFVLDLDIQSRAWNIARGEVALALIFGATKYGAREFAVFCEKEGIPYLFLERSPLMKNGKKGIYVDAFGTTYLSQWGRQDFWNTIKMQSLTPEWNQALAQQRALFQNSPLGVEEQQAPFLSAEQLKTDLGIPQEARLAYVPLQVDSDATLIDRRCSPWIENMDHMIAMVLKHLEHLPEDYYVVFKKHPQGSDPLIPLQSPRVRSVGKEFNANALVQAADLVITVNSGSAMEALLMHKPVISLGNSFYTDKGLALEPRSIAELIHTFSRVNSFQVPVMSVDLFLAHFLFDAVFDLTRDDEARRLSVVFEARMEANRAWLENPETLMRQRHALVYNNYMEIQNKHADHFGRYDFVSELVRGKRVLDVSAGCGYGTYFLAGEAQEVYGVENDERLLTYARENWSKNNVRYLRVDLNQESLPFEEGFFDAVVSFETIEHLQARERFLQEIARVIKPGGDLFISTPQAPMGNPTHVYEYELGEFADVVFHAGFDIRDWYTQPYGNRVFQHKGKPIRGKQNLLMARRELDPAMRRNLYFNSQLKIAIELTSRCNLQCSMCGQPVMERPKTDMDYALLENLIEQIQGEGYRLWQLHGYGEPVLFKNFERLLEEMRSRKIQVERSFSTNVIPLTERKTESLLNAGFAEVHEEAGCIRLCIDSLRPDVYRQLRVGGDFERAKKNAKNFIAKVQERGKGLGLNIQRLLSDLNPDEPADAYYREFPGVKVRTQVVGRHHDKSRDHTIVKFEEFGDRRDQCPYIFDNNFFVLTNGKVTKCCLDVEGAQAIGNVKDQTLDEIIHSETLRQQRDDFKNQRWEKEYLSLCRVCTGDECSGLSEARVDQEGYVSVGELPAGFDRILVMATARESQVRPILLALRGKYPQAGLDLLTKEEATFSSLVDRQYLFQGMQLSLKTLPQDVQEAISQGQYSLAVIPFNNQTGEGYSHVVEALLKLGIANICGMTIDGKLIKIKGLFEHAKTQHVQNGQDLVQISS